MAIKITKNKTVYTFSKHLNSMNKIIVQVLRNGSVRLNQEDGGEMVTPISEIDIEGLLYLSEVFSEAAELAKKG